MKLYTTMDWMVRRWDRINGGRKVAPKSFCQFWRAVLLWATLASLPVIGRYFVWHPTTQEAEVKLQLPAKPTELPRSVRILSQVCAYISGCLIRVVWKALWPLRQLGWRVVGVADWVANWYGDSEHTWLRRVSGIAWWVFVTFCLLVILFEVGLVIFLAWQANTFIFLVVAGAVVVGSTLAVVFRRQLIVALLVVGDVLGTLVYVLIAAKRHVCPPVEIKRDC